MKCRDCKYSASIYERSVGAWRAFCDHLGTAQVISEYTTDEDTVPVWDVDLGRTNPYCAYPIIAKLEGLNAEIQDHSCRECGYSGKAQAVNGKVSCPGCGIENDIWQEGQPEPFNHVAKLEPEEESQ